MKRVDWIDKHGYRRASIVAEGDPPESGVRLEPPDLDALDWDALKRALWNELQVRGIWTVRDATKGLDAAIRAVFHGPLLRLYKRESGGS